MFHARPHTVTARSKKHQKPLHLNLSTQKCLHWIQNKFLKKNSCRIRIQITAKHLKTLNESWLFMLSIFCLGSFEVFKFFAVIAWSSVYRFAVVQRWGRKMGWVVVAEHIKLFSNSSACHRRAEKVHQCNVGLAKLQATVACSWAAYHAAAKRQTRMIIQYMPNDPTFTFITRLLLAHWQPPLWRQLHLVGRQEQL